jgi:hypothetical protein
VIPVDCGHVAVVHRRWNGSVVGDAARVPPPELVAEARRVPGGWVYEIESGVDPMGRVPPELVIGAWAVSESGELTGEFISNPKYRGRS